MKKQLTLTILSAVALAIMAQEQQMDDERLKDIITSMLRPRFINLERDVDENGNLRPRPSAEGLGVGF